MKTAAPTRGNKSPIKSSASPSKRRNVSVSQSTVMGEPAGLSKLDERQVECDHLQTQINVMQAKVDINEDLQRQVQELQRQLEASQKTNVQLA